ncbi:MAG: choice-of-anchor D domain-containing protein, partial [Candidatus Latescibacteria bacterium]|nr:choice-of-anchor D domain-containing protein [Candidatus Latescibacterota bacterium]
MMEKTINNIYMIIAVFMLILLGPDFAFSQIDMGRGIELYDFTRNGILDRAIIWFITPIDSISVGLTSLGEFNVEGRLVSGIYINQDNDRNGILDGYNALTIRFHESGVYDTDQTPQVTYNGTTLRYRNGQIVPQIAQSSAVEVDRAPPILIRAVTKDIDNDGLFDQYWLWMSEPVISDNPGCGFYMTQSGYAFEETGHIINGKFINLAVVEKSLPSGLKPSFTYESASINQLSIPPSADNLSGIGDIRDNATNPYGGLTPNYFYITTQNSGDENIPPGLLYNERIRLISPNGGERWRPGFSYNITWESLNVMLVKIDYSLNAGTTWINITSNAYAQDGIYLWHAPQTASDSCLIRITDVNLDYETDQSYQNFTISDPKISLSTESLDIGEAVVGDTVTGTFLISNIGKGDLNISSIHNYLRDFSISDTTFTIYTDSSKVVTVFFSPTQTGIIRDSFVITSNDFDHSIREVRVNGRGIAPEITVSTTALDFGNVHTGSDSSMVLTISNDGIGVLEISGINSSDETFTVDQTSFSVPQNQSRNVTVTYTPDKLGFSEATIIIHSSDYDEQTIPVRVSGTGVTPEINLSHISIRFNNTEVNSSSSEYITFMNEGTGDLIVSDISSDNAIFKLDQKSFIVAPDSSHIVKITFSPTEPGIQRGTISITSNDTNEGFLQLSTNGTGVILDFKVTPALIDIGDVDIGNSDFGSFTVTNNGTVNLEITNIKSDLTDFSTSLTTGFLQPGGSKSFTVNFTPSTYGTRIATLSILTNLGEISTQATGTGIGPSGVVTPTSLGIGVVEIGAVMTGFFTITNKGNDDLIINNITINRTTFEVDRTSFTVSPGSSEDVVVTFLPNRTGYRDAILTVTWNDYESDSYPINIDATVIAPKITAVPAMLDIGSIDLGTSGSGSFELKNEGLVPLIASSISISNNVFTVSPDSVYLEPGQSENIIVNFAPVTPGSIATEITIESNGIDEATLTVDVNGTGVTPDISITPQKLDFGNTDIGSFKPLNFTIKNVGSSDLVTGIITSNNDNFTVSSDPVTLSAGKSKVITVVFSPVVLGTDNAVITIPSNDLDEETVTIDVSGIGATPDILLLTDTIYFGDVVVSESDTAFVSVKNEGTSNLILSEISSNIEDITTNPSSASVAPGETIIIRVIYTPLNAENQNATISIKSNDLDENNVSVGVTGRGVTPDITLSKTTFSFGNIEAGTEITDSFTITNDGSFILEIYSILSDNDVVTVSPESVSIEPGSNATVTVTVKPTGRGIQNAEITLISNDLDENNVTVYVTGTGISPEITISAALIEIGSVKIGSNNTGSFNIVNDGTSDLIVDRILSSNDTFTVNPESATIHPGNSRTITVIFSPKVNGGQNAQIKITSNDLDESAINVEVYGTGVSSEITVSPTSIDFGNVFIGSSLSKDFTLLNEGTSSLFVGNITSDNEAFTIEPASLTIEPGKSAIIKVTFTSMTTGFHETKINISSNDVDEGTVIINANGTGKVPEVSISAMIMNIGTVEVGSHSSESFIVTNEETESQIVSTITVDKETFTVAPSTLTLGPGMSKTVEVTFTPSNTGTQSSTIKITNNDIEESTITATVNGVGIAPKITLSSGAIQFGKIEVGNIETKNITIRNSGNVEQVK